MKNNIEYYDIRQTTTICGYDSISMVDYLCRSGLIQPIAEKGRGRGRKRFFTFKDLLILKVYKKLFDMGVSVSRLKRAFEDSEEFRSLTATRTSLKNSRGEANILFTDGKNIYVREKRDHFIQAGSNGQFVFSFMVSLQDLHMELSNFTKKEIPYKERKTRDGFYRDTKALSK